MVQKNSLPWAPFYANSLAPCDEGDGQQAEEQIDMTLSSLHARNLVTTDSRRDPASPLPESIFALFNQLQVDEQGIPIYDWQPLGLPCHDHGEGTQASVCGTCTLQNNR